MYFGGEDDDLHNVSKRKEFEAGLCHPEIHAPNAHSSICICQSLRKNYISSTFMKEQYEQLLQGQLKPVLK
jgi:hypothetical protein